MEKRRTDLTVKLNERKSVVIKMANGYFFKSREGHMFGPYQTEQQAINARQLFIYSMTGDEKDKPQLSPKEYKSLFNVEEIDCNVPVDKKGFA